MYEINYLIGCWIYERTPSLSKGWRCIMCGNRKNWKFNFIHKEQRLKMKIFYLLCLLIDICVKKEN